MEKKLSLKFIWGIRLKLRAEGRKLWSEGDKLVPEGYRLLAEGGKMMAEGDRLWADAVLEAYGNIKMYWVYEDGREVCKLETGEVFERDEAHNLWR